MEQPSPAQPGRVEENEEGKEGGGERRSVAEEGPRPPLSLLDLPDELLLLIFQQVHLSLSGQEPLTPLSISLRHVAINKRIFAVVQPIWWSLLVLPRSPSVLEELLFDLSVNRSAHRHIKTVTATIPSDFPAVTLAALLPLSHLTSLTLGFSYPNDCPWRITVFLRQFKHLESLDLLGYPEPEDRSFSLERDIPSLRTFKTAGIEFLILVMENGTSNLQHFVDRAPDVGSYPIPLGTLRRLTLEPEGGVLYNSHAWLSDLDHELDKPVPFRHLRRLSLKFPSMLPCSALEETAFSSEHLVETFIALQASRLEHLDLFDVENLDWLADAAGLALPTVRTLELQGNLPLYEETNRIFFRRLFQLFPSLATLHLRDFPLSPSSSTSATSVDTVPRLPAFLRKATMASTLLELRHRGEGEQREMRWTRRTRGESFEAEGWTVE
ncbi:hypothetical protein JCM10213v2_006033 [Rhodosporidiobolus nylandii]